ncbi:hypothetical protein CSOJ01_15988, partial [Colletotrichum sojae]
MVAARFYKNAARYRLERPEGMRLSSLEKIFGSQSFASALERLIVVRAQILLGALILSTWAMSPLGGQSSSRMLRFEGRKVESYHPLHYDNRVYQYPVWGDSDIYELSASDIVQALYSGSLLSPKKQQRAFSDLWERPKIPQLPRDLIHAESGRHWRAIDTDALQAGREQFTSLIGLNIQSPDFSDNTTQYEFDVESTYFSFDCRMIADTDSTEVIGNITFWKPEFTTEHNKTNLLEVLPEYELEFSESFVALLAYPMKDETPPYLLYTSFSTHGQAYSVFNCSMEMPSVETKLICTAQGCSARKQRQVLGVRDNFLDIGSLLYQTQSAMDAWPSMTKVVRFRASATENFIANDENVYANQELRNWTGIDEGMFSSQLTAAFNTAWEAGTDPYNITKGSSFSEPASNHADTWTNQTSAFVTRVEDVYSVNVAWAAILIFATTVLQALAVGGLVLRCLIRGPDVLGFASTLTRDNRFVP